MRIRVFQGVSEIGITAIEVRARKLNYLTDYRRMIADVAEAATEAVMDRFAVSEQSFAPADGGDPPTLYQRFAFLQSLFTNDVFQAAIHRARDGHMSHGKRLMKGAGPDRGCAVIEGSRAN